MPWIRTARGFIGCAEVPGHAFNPVIREFWYAIKARWLWDQIAKGDEAPWCGCFVAYCLLGRAELPADPYRAKAWLNWGQPCFDSDAKKDRPAPGCVVVYDRKGGGHVGFVVGVDRRGYLMTLGGNQRDRVGIDPFDPARVLGYRWPDEYALAMPEDPLPVYAPTLAVSNNES